MISITFQRLFLGYLQFPLKLPHLGLQSPHCLNQLIHLPSGIKCLHHLLLELSLVFGYEVVQLEDLAGFRCLDFHELLVSLS